MKNLLLCLVGLCWAASTLYCQDTYRVYLTNKGISPFIKGSELYTQTEALHNARCLTRRAKVLSKDSLLSITDAPLYAPYLQDIRKTGAKVLLQLRWSNYVVVQCDSSTMISLKNKPYVKTITGTGQFLVTQSLKVEKTHQNNLGPEPFAIVNEGCGSFHYGRSLTQNAMLHTTELHAMGEIGSDCLMGVLDNGFRWQVHDCFNNMRLVAEYDFMFGDSLTANDSLDVAGQDNHGTTTLSTIVGYLPDSLIGTAPGVKVILAKTEDMRFERRIEEDNYAAALEWIESMGADLSTSSVGYSSFDDPELSYPYSMLDGHSTIVDKAVNRATHLGMVCCTAAGNSGGDSRSLISPGDADSAITVGAYSDDSLHVAKFTSKGPNASGVLKPDVAALGVDVIVANVSTRTSLGTGTGTSFATPSLAGGIALLMSQFSDLKPYDVRQLLYRNASQNSNPDSSVGHGLPDMMKVAEDHGIVVSPLVSYAAPTYQYFIFYIRSKYPLTKATLFAAKQGNVFAEHALQSTSVAHQYVARFPITETGAAINYYIEVNDEQRSRRVPEESFKTIHFGDSHFPCGIEESGFPSSVEDPGLFSAEAPTAIRFGTPTIQYQTTNAHGTVLLYNELGALISSQMINSETIMLPVTSLSPGLYAVELRSLTSTIHHTFLIY